MLTALKPVDEQKNIVMQGFGLFDRVYDSASIDMTDWNTGRDPLEDADKRKAYRVSDWDEAGSINKQSTVLFKPMLGIIDQKKLIPLRCAPLQIESELVSDSAECVYVGNAPELHPNRCQRKLGDFRHPMQNGSAYTGLIPPK